MIRKRIEAMNRLERNWNFMSINPIMKRLEFHLRDSHDDAQNEQHEEAV